jgi:hypothetical protein
MIKRALILLFFCCFLISPEAQSQDKPFDFKSVELGVTIDQFKMIPPSVKPPSEYELKYSRYEPINCNCFDEKIGKSPSFACYWGEGKWRTSSNKITVADAPTISHKFLFAKDGDVYRLAQIKLVLESKYWSLLPSAMKAKYGPSAKEEQETLKNALGGEFINFISIWQNSSSRIELRRFGSGLKFTTIVYTFLPLKAQIEQAEADEEKEKSSLHAKDL